MPRPNRPAPPAAPARWRGLLCAAALLAATAAAYGPAFQAGFIWDDDDYVHANKTLTRPDALRRIWTTAETPQYYPLVFSSFWAERKAWGLDPRGYHAVNVLLHGVNAVLLWRALAVLGAPGALLAAGLFALHPVHVETAAWITERKNLLSAFFALLSLLGFLRFRRETEGTRGARLWYAASLAAFACALLSKTVACALPPVLLVLLWWREGRAPGRRDVAALAPFFALGLALGFVTIWFETHRVGAAGEAWELGLAARAALAARIPWFYLGKLAWPASLSFVYPRWAVDPARALSWGPALAWGALAVAVWRLRPPWAAAFAAAAACFLLILAPALGFIDVYPFRYSFVADHFQYHASAAPLALAAAAAATRLPPAALRGAGAAALLLLASLTWQRCRAFASLETLWRDTLAKNPGAWIAHNNLATLLLERGRVDEAREHLARATALQPKSPEIPNNLGSALLRLGRPAEAEPFLRRALALDAGYAPAYFNLAMALEGLGRADEALAQYAEAARRDPGNALAHNNLGLCWLRKGRPAEALGPLQAAVRADPGYAQGHNNLAVALAMLGRLEEAKRQWRLALSLDPRNPEAKGNLLRHGGG